MKKFIKKLAKKAEGFTLVELVVVIAILGILAGVAVPAYSGYLNKANEAADTTVLDSVKTAAQAYYAKNGSVTEVTVTPATDDDALTINIKYDDNGTDTLLVDDDDDAINLALEADFKLYFTGSETGTVSVSLKSDKFENGAKWTDNTREWAKIS